MNEPSDGNREVKLLTEIRDISQESLELSREILRIYRRYMKLAIWGTVLIFVLGAAVLIAVAIDTHLFIERRDEEMREEHERFTGALGDSAATVREQIRCNSRMTVAMSNSRASMLAGSIRIGFVGYGNPFLVRILR